MIRKQEFDNLADLAIALREDDKIFNLIYAENGTGKTRLSIEFKTLGKMINRIDGLIFNKYKKSKYPPLLKSRRIKFYSFKNSSFHIRNIRIVLLAFNVLSEKLAHSPYGTTKFEYKLPGDTLYFNAYTEDLFQWDNDIENDLEPVLMINTHSRIFKDFFGTDLENRIKPLLERYVRFNLRFDYNRKAIAFFYDEDKEKNVKISKGEESIFILCVFIAFMELALQRSSAYEGIRYIYIDDPISSLDEHNIITIANHISQILKSYNLKPESRMKIVISTHHALFFNVICSEFQDKINKYSLEKDFFSDQYVFKSIIQDVPFFQHITSLRELAYVAKDGKVYTYHFNMLRTILEKTASFLGYDKFDKCLKLSSFDDKSSIHTRYVNTLSHGKYSLYNPSEMHPDNKKYFIEIVDNLIDTFRFNSDILDR